MLAAPVVVRPSQLKVRLPLSNPLAISLSLSLSLVMYERVSVHQMLVDPANPVELKTRLWTELGREAYLSSSGEQLSCREREGEWWELWF